MRANLATTSEKAKTPWLAILVAALGYFVDVYDIWLYASVKKQSLAGIGYTSDQDVKKYGELLLNWQMAGFMVGAILFGVWADKKGRLSVLFVSILVYSFANLANGFVTDYSQYALCRFIAGCGLAGELGAGIALVSELVDKKNRGWATTFVATIGVLGSLAAPKLAQLTDWRVSYYIGGGMGLALLLMRIGVYESGMFSKLTENIGVRRGDILGLFKTRNRVRRYLAVILCGLPVWYFAGLLMTGADVMQKNLNLNSPVPGPEAVFIGALGLSVGDVIFGGLSQLIKSRRLAMLIAYGLMTTAVLLIFSRAKTGSDFYMFMLLGGLGAGFWAVFVTTAGEVFGTNLRATVATTAPSFVRGAVIPMTWLRSMFENQNISYVAATGIVGVIVLILSLLSLVLLPETYGKSMDFVEED